jgi:hypothetical protein
LAAASFAVTLSSIRERADREKYSSFATSFFSVGGASAAAAGERRTVLAGNTHVIGGATRRGSGSTMGRTMTAQHGAMAHQPPAADA